MLDLKKLAEQFIQAYPQSFNTNFPGDDAAIQAISATGANRAVRERSLLDWLHGYSVIRSFPPEKSQEVAGRIITFADNRNQMILH